MLKKFLPWLDNDFYMTAKEILSELKTLGKETTKQTFSNHGAPYTSYGVKIEELKKIQKKIKKNYGLSIELYNSGISDAQYLAGLIADETRMTKVDLQLWAEQATWYLLSEYTVAWITAESPYGHELALKWIDDKREFMQAAGWSALASLVSIKKDEDLDLKELKSLLKRVEMEIHSAANRTRYTMNAFVIALGGYVPALTEEAKKAGKAIGKVSVDMGGTACKVPFSPDYIQKMEDKGVIGRKKKMARC